MGFKVIHPGLLSLLQDSGRFGYQNIGITNGGPMDEHAYHWCNHLLNNPVNTNVLEITFGLLKLEVTKATNIALTGADLGARLNDKPLAVWSSYTVKPGDQLSFEQPINGLRAYLGVTGGFTCTPQLGSCSTVIREQLGGMNSQGLPLKAGDVVPFLVSRPMVHQKTPEWAIENYDEPLELGVIKGYQYNDFSVAGRRDFFHSTYSITQHIDRMGYRLNGKAISCQRDGIISEGIAFGAIQIPGNGQPIILMRDRQTIGGYPKIGTLGGLGASRLAQRLPDQEVSFRPMDISEAEIERRLFIRTFCN
ncbi:allophanate hydrolase [Vibrio sp. 10N.286.49.B3]|uniref:5-oxoprolinase subunit C family protein n=1 Tax=Vibrio sp. 10N.286.49.B3 TaxID=1880855 RepID=UPI000C8465CE|nr:biotin-dependent carboxyltransferase family protein [Vibrio sp. 10N.286.49.B3]PMH44893.1 allophanate hydrolase [Vibrio sp. 10N.286.49.B3]